MLVKQTESDCSAYIYCLCIDGTRERNIFYHMAYFDTKGSIVMWNDMQKHVETAMQLQIQFTYVPSTKFPWLVSPARTPNIIPNKS